MSRFMAATAPDPFEISRYPTELIEAWPLGRHDHLTLRPVLPQDDAPLGRMLSGLSASSRQCRFFGGVNLLSQRWLQALTQVDYERHLAFVVTHQESGGEVIVAEARYVLDAQNAEYTGHAEHAQSAEFALLVDDRWQRHGIGQRLMGALINTGASHGLRWLHGDVLQTNTPMLALMQRHGFACSQDPEDASLTRVERSLDGLLACGHLPMHALHPRRSPGGWRRWLAQPFSPLTRLAGLTGSAA